MKAPCPLSLVEITPLELLHDICWLYAILCLRVQACTRVCVVLPDICPVFTTLSTAGVQAKLRPEPHKHTESFVNTDSPLLNMCPGAATAAKSLRRSSVDCLENDHQSDNIKKNQTTGTFSHLLCACLASSANRNQSLPWGRTGHGAPPCRWSPGSLGPQCSCCRSSPCSGSGLLWCPGGLNGWWCLGILQGNKPTTTKKKTIGEFLRII